MKNELHAGYVSNIHRINDKTQFITIVNCFSADRRHLLAY